jgi:MFS family permease
LENSESTTTISVLLLLLHLRPHLSRKMVTLETSRFYSSSSPPPPPPSPSSCSSPSPFVVSELLVCLFVVVDVLGFSLVLPLLPYLATEAFGATPTTVGLLMSANAIAQLIAAPFLGRYSNKVKGKDQEGKGEREGTSLTLLLRFSSPLFSFLLLSSLSLSPSPSLFLSVSFSSQTFGSIWKKTTVVALRHRHILLLSSLRILYK